MRVTVESATVDPVAVCSRAAGRCYGKDDESLRRLENCFKAGHLGVFEHASVTFLVEGISRACSHQIVRHRVASFNQTSQRYCKMGEDYAAIVPESVQELGFETLYAAHVDACKAFYLKMVKAGVPPEDARYVLPQAGTTELYVTMNARELFHFWDLRTSPRAQWEVRAVAFAMLEAVKGLGEEWAAVVGLWEDQEHKGA